MEGQMTEEMEVTGRDGRALMMMLSTRGESLAQSMLDKESVEKVMKELRVEMTGSLHHPSVGGRYRGGKREDHHQTRGEDGDHLLLTREEADMTHHPRRLPEEQGREEIHQNRREEEAGTGPGRKT